MVFGVKVTKKTARSQRYYKTKAFSLGVAMIGLVAGTGCATALVMGNSMNNVSTETVTHTQVLVEDAIVAFGRSAQTLPEMPPSSVVIVGEKNSYVLTEGGYEMERLLTNLSAEHIQVDSDMDFYSPNNDGYFTGKMALSYAKPQGEFQRIDYEFFLKNNGQECTTQSDNESSVQRFCFNVPIKGAVYPQVSNIDTIRSKYNTLSKPYAVSIYTRTTTQKTTADGVKQLQTLAILPFAVAFDVVTSPILMIILLSD